MFKSLSEKIENIISSKPNELVINKENEKLKNQIETSNTKIADLQMQVKALEEEKIQNIKDLERKKLNTDVINVVDLAIKNKKIADNLKDPFIAIGNNLGIEELNKTIEKLPIINNVSIINNADIYNSDYNYNASIGLARVRENIKKSKI
jgi:hypothetical protein